MGTSSRSKSIRLLLILTLLSLVGCDHVSKHVAQNELRSRSPVTLIAGLLDLRYVENHDLAFGMLRVVPADVRKQLILIGGSALMLLLLLIGRRWTGDDLASRLALSMIVAGGLGNLLDRLVRGYVVDFIHLNNWPVFNVADIWVTLGALLLLYRQWRRPRLEQV